MGDRGEDPTGQVMTERPRAGFMTSLAHQPEGVVVVVDKWAEPYRETLMRELLRAQLKSDEAQLIADEFAGVLEAASVGEHRGIRSKHGWIKRVIALCKAGEFVPEYGRRVKARRQRFPAEPVQQALPASTNHEVVDAHLDIMRSALKQPRRHL
jgi:hypothetical protein